MRLCDSWNAAETPCASGERTKRVDLALVDAVAELVEAGQDPVEAVLVEVRREPDVRGRHRGRERVHRAVEAPRGAVHAPALEDLEREPPLRVAWEPAAQARVVDRCRRRRRRGSAARARPSAEPKIVSTSAVVMPGS